MTEENTDPETGKSWEESAMPLGWHPQEEFNGDPEAFTSAEDFVKKGRESLPILRENSKKQARELADLKVLVEEQKTFYERDSKVRMEDMQAAYDKELARIVDEGDTEAFNKLEKPATAPVVDGPSPEYQKFVGEQEWYGTDADMTAVANARSAQLLQDFPGFTIQQNMDKTLVHVKEAFPQKFGEAPASNGRGSPVEGGRRVAKKKSGHSYEDLPSEDKAVCNGFIKQGIIKDREAYVKSYDWSE